jgi:hypothetical protein
MAQMLTKCELTIILRASRDSYCVCGLARGGKVAAARSQGQTSNRLERHWNLPIFSAAQQAGGYPHDYERSTRVWTPWGIFPYVPSNHQRIRLISARTPKEAEYLVTAIRIGLRHHGPPPHLVRLEGFALTG